MLLLTKLMKSGPFCLPDSSGGVNRASGRGTASPEAGRFTMSVPIAFKFGSLKDYQKH